MSQYLYCDECGKIFPEEWARRLWGKQGIVLGCPDCRNTSLQVAASCKICGEPMPVGKEYCDECLKWMLDAWATVVDRVMCKRIETGRRKSADYVDCQQAALDWMEDVNIL